MGEKIFQWQMLNVWIEMGNISHVIRSFLLREHHFFLTARKYTWKSGQRREWHSKVHVWEEASGKKPSLLCNKFLNQELTIFFWDSNFSNILFLLSMPCSKQALLFHILWGRITSHSLFTVICKSQAASFSDVC